MTLKGAPPVEPERLSTDVVVGNRVLDGTFPADADVDKPPWDWFSVGDEVGEVESEAVEVIPEGFEDCSLPADALVLGDGEPPEFEGVMLLETL